MGHRLSSRNDDDTSKFRRFGYMLVADPDYVLALYPYHTVIPYHVIVCVGALVRWYDYEYEVGTSTIRE